MLLVEAVRSSSSRRASHRMFTMLGTWEREHTETVREELQGSSRWASLWKFRLHSLTPTNDNTQNNPIQECICNFKFSN